MIRKGDRKGQFFLLAAIVISVVIISFAAVSNYAQKKTPIKVYDLGDELGIESGKVLDFGISQGENPEFDGRPLLEHFTEVYDKYAGEDKDIFFIFGNSEKVTLITYNQIIIGNVELISGTTSTGVNVPGQEIIRETITPEEGKISIVIGENTYDFELKPGENFFFVISQQIGDETIVVKS